MHIKYVQFSVYQLYLNKAVKKEKRKQAESFLFPPCQQGEGLELSRDGDTKADVVHGTLEHREAG